MNTSFKVNKPPLFLFCFKNVIPKELRSHLACKCLCSSCNAAHYGKTECDLNVRSVEHICLSLLSGNRVACKVSAIFDHLLLHKHNNSSFNNIAILCCKNNAFKPSLRESILIKRRLPELKKNVSSVLLLLFNELLCYHQWNIDKQFWYHFVKKQTSKKVADITINLHQKDWQTGWPYGWTDKSCELYWPYSHV